VSVGTPPHIRVFWFFQKGANAGLDLIERELKMNERKKEWYRDGFKNDCFF
jgi:hypothetical protein